MFSPGGLLAIVLMVGLEPTRRTIVVQMTPFMLTLFWGRGLVPMQKATFSAASKM